MSNNDKFSNIRSQSQFCMELMSRLNNDIQNAGAGQHTWGMDSYCRKQEDIRRIRRELMTLQKMLDPWGNS